MKRIREGKRMYRVEVESHLITLKGKHVTKKSWSYKYWIFAWLRGFYETQTAGIPYIRWFKIIDEEEV